MSYDSQFFDAVITTSKPYSFTPSDLKEITRSGRFPPRNVTLSLTGYVYRSGKSPFATYYPPRMSIETLNNKRIFPLTVSSSNTTISSDSSATSINVNLATGQGNENAWVSNVTMRLLDPLPIPAKVGFASILGGASLFSTNLHEAFGISVATDFIKTHYRRAVVNGGVSGISVYFIKNLSQLTSSDVWAITVGSVRNNPSSYIHEFLANEGGAFRTLFERPLVYLNFETFIFEFLINETLVKGDPTFPTWLTNEPYADKVSATRLTTIDLISNSFPSATPLGRGTDVFFEPLTQPNESSAACSFRVDYVPH